MGAAANSGQLVIIIGFLHRCKLNSETAAERFADRREPVGRAAAQGRIEGLARAYQFHERRRVYVESGGDGPLVLE
jgi:hypothetical protein